MSILELIPIGAFLALLTDQVLETALAARDVLIEKESFKALSKYLYDIEPVLKELQLRELKDTQAARQALECLKEDIKKAKDLVDKYKSRARFYLLVRCRHIVREIQDVTRDIGRSLAALSLASTEVLSDISEKVNRLHVEMQKAEFEASQSQLRIVEKLDQGLREQKSDQNFANNMLEEIARAVGVPVEPLEISEELANLRREKEEAAARKERAEEIFLEQVIELLSRADAANNYEEIRKQYYCRVESIEKYATKEDFIPPLRAFVCPISRTVMTDPVSLCTGTTCERSAIEAWLDSGQITDPETGQILEESMLRCNIALRQSIEEWRELNYCLKIRSVKGNLQSGLQLAFEEAFNQLQEIVKENPINKDWIAIAGIIDIIVSIVGSSRNKDLKIRALLTLNAIIEGHTRNKDRVIEVGGLDHIVSCLGRGPNVSRTAIELLFEILQDGSRWNESVCKKLKQQSSSIFFLVMFLNSANKESEAIAENILSKLCDDDDTISRAAAVNWYKPLIDRLCHGPESSKLSMARTLAQMQLVDENLRLLGEGVIPPLVEMASGNLESKDVAFSALVKLSSSHENKALIAAAGGIPLILDMMFASPVPTIIRVKCSEIVERITSKDGIEFLLDAHGVRLELQLIITNLMAILQNSSSSPSVRKPALSTLLNVCKSEDMLAEKTIAVCGGVSIVLPLLEDPVLEIRELAIKLIYHFSQHEPAGIGDFLLVDRRLDAFVRFLEDETRGDLQTAAAGLLANLPKSELVLTKRLIELDVLSILLNILRLGTVEAKENVLGVLFRFMDPDNIKMQQMLVELGAYPLLISFLKSSSTTTKARAAALIGNLSSNSPRLTIAPARTSCWCFKGAHVSACEVHGGICDVASTFCLLKANALPDLVKLLQENDYKITHETLLVLGTLVQEGSYYGGAKALHKAGAINPMLDVLGSGVPDLQEIVLEILEKVFKAREVADYYCAIARLPLISLSTRSYENGNLGKRAAKVLVELERYSKSRSMPLF